MAPTGGSAVVDGRERIFTASSTVISNGSLTGVTFTSGAVVSAVLAVGAGLAVGLPPAPRVGLPATGERWKMGDVPLGEGEVLSSLKLRSPPPPQATSSAAIPARRSSAPSRRDMSPPLAWINWAP